MTVKNTTRNTVISSHVQELISFFQKSQGLLRKTNSRSLFFKTRFGIHTFGLSDSIDVVIIDNNNCVAVLRECLQKNRIFLWNPQCNAVLELPKGTIKKSKTKKGDTISFELGYLNS